MCVFLLGMRFLCGCISEPMLKFRTPISILGLCKWCLTTLWKKNFDFASTVFETCFPNRARATSHTQLWAIGDSRGCRASSFARRASVGGGGASGFVLSSSVAAPRKHNNGRDGLPVGGLISFWGSPVCSARCAFVLLARARPPVHVAYLLTLGRRRGVGPGGLAAEIESIALPTRLGKKFGGYLSPLVGPTGLQ
jgi:hypothetical protein